MSSRLIIGDDAPIPDALGIVWVVLAGWAMGTTALGALLDNPPFEVTGPLQLMFVGLAPAGLSAGAAWMGTRGKGIAATIALTMAGAIATALLCPPATWLALVVSGGDTGVGSVGLGDSIVSVVVTITMVGALFAIPLGLTFGIVYSFALSVLEVLQQQVRSRSSLDVGLGVGGAALLFAGVCCGMATIASMPSHTAFTTPALTPSEHLWTPLLVSALGLGAMLFATGRTIARQWFIARARRGAIEGWAVVPASEVEDAEALPRLFALGRANAVLVRRASTAAGAFRTGEASTAMLRV